MFIDRDNIIEPWETLTDKVMFMVAATTGMRRGEILALTWNQIDFEKNVITVDRAFKDKLAKEIGTPKWDKIRKFVLLPKKTAKWLEKIKPELKIYKKDAQEAIQLTHEMANAEKLESPDKPYKLPLPLKNAPQKYSENYDWGMNLITKWENLIDGFYDDFVFKKNGKHYNYRDWSIAFNFGMKNMGIDREKRNIRPHSFRHTLNSILIGKGYSDIRIRHTLGWSDIGIQENYTHLEEQDNKEQANIMDDVLSISNEKET